MARSVGRYRSHGLSGAEAGHARPAHGSSLLGLVATRRAFIKAAVACAIPTGVVRTALRATAYRADAGHASPAPSVEDSGDGAAPAARPFAQDVGWAYTARGGQPLEQIQADLTRMRDLGCNVVYIAQPNPGEPFPNLPEPGLSYSVYQALEDHSWDQAAARSELDAVLNTLDAAQQLGMRVVLTIGYQLQMGPDWNAAHPNDLRRFADGRTSSAWGEKPSASPYSLRFRADAEAYYRWVNETILARYANVVAVNLSDEPMGSDYSAHAMSAFRARYGKDFASASDYERGEFQSGVPADFVGWAASLWKDLNPSVRTMATFHIQRDAPFFPDFARVMAAAPDTFAFSADTQLHDAPSTFPLTDDDKNLLHGLVRTLGFLSATYHRGLMLWTSANAWGLAGQSSHPGGVPEALYNLDVVQRVSREVGGRLDMLMAWGWNIFDQGVYDDHGALAYLDKEKLITAVSAAMASLRDSLPQSDALPVERVIYYPRSALYADVGRTRADLLFDNRARIDLRARTDLTTQRTVYLSDPVAVVRAARLGARIESLAPPDVRYVPETDHVVVGAFLTCWSQPGGLQLFGYPLTDELEERNPADGRTYTVQYFERQRFEWQPERRGTPYEVQLGLLGVTAAQRQDLLDTAPFQPLPAGTQSDATCRFFPETGHRLGSGFKAYWQSHGLDMGDPDVSFRESLALFGYPISEEFVDPQTGLVMQYFERAVFEYHPGNPEPYKVLLRRLGADELAARASTT